MTIFVNPLPNIVNPPGIPVFIFSFRDGFNTCIRTGALPADCSGGTNVLIGISIAILNNRFRAGRKYNRKLFYILKVKTLPADISQG